MAAFGAEVRRKILREHLDLGVHKCVSYLPVQTIETVLGLSVDEFVKMAGGRGLAVHIADQRVSYVKSGSVHLYIESELRSLLDRNRELLLAEAWPTVPSDFIDRTARNLIEPSSPIMPVIREAFGDR